MKRFDVALLVVLFCACSLILIQGCQPPPPPPPLELARYPTMETPGEVAAHQEFAVLVSLTEERITPGVDVLHGDTTDTGELILRLPEGDYWDLDVILSAPGFSIRGGANTASIHLPREGDSTPALFHLRPDTLEETPSVRTLYATLWHDGAYLARIARDVTVVSDPTPIRLRDIL